MADKCAIVNHVKNINNDYYNTLSTPTSCTNKPKTIMAYPDSCATGHFVPQTFPGTNMKHEQIKVQCANNSTMASTATIALNIPELPPPLREATAFREMTKGLLSVPVLCDGDMEVTFRKKDMDVKDKNNKVIIQGKRDTESPLWIIPIVRKEKQLTNNVHKGQSLHQANSAYHQHTLPKLTAYLHSCVGSIPPKTWIKAINNGWFDSWPGLTAAAVSKHLPKSPMTVMGHLHRIRKGIRPSDKIDKEELMEEEMLPELPLPPPRGHIDRQHYIGVDAVKFEKLKGTISTDLPGRFPITSAQGNAYIFIMYDYDGNSIMAEPIKNRKKESLLYGFHTCVTALKRAGITPIIHRLDNEISKDMITRMEQEKMDFQIAAPGDHRLNFAERAIQTFKNHFVSVLHGCDPQFPANQWDRLVPQAVMTLNMVRPSRINPRLSAYNQIHGIFNYEKTPLAPPGCKVIVHERPQERRTWADHGVAGFYIGPAMHHFRNYYSYIPTTRGVRVSNTVEFFPAHVDMPQTSSEDRLAQVTQDLITVLKNPHPPTPFLHQGDKTNDAIRTLQKIFQPPQQADDRKPVSPPRVQETPYLAPRVLQSDTTRRQSPRVAEQLNKRKTGNITTGTEVKRKFHNKLYTGTVTRYDNEAKLYYIKYTDGDSEEMTEAEVNKYKCTSNKSVTERLKRRMKRHQVNATTQAAQKAKDHPLPQHFAYSVWDDETGRMLEFRHLLNHKNSDIKKKWGRSGANEYGRLMQGIGKKRPPEERIEGTNSMQFIKKKQVPKGKIITYARFVADIRPQKDEKERMRLTAGGDRLIYDGKKSTETAGLETTKMLLNSVVSTPNAKFACFDIGNMYLNTKLPSPEYMRIHRSMIPDEVMEEYNVEQYLDNEGYAYVEITGAIYGLAQSGYLANQDLIENLAKYGYYPSKRTPGLWHHKTNTVKFSLVVDDFGVKYNKKEDAQHLLDAIAAHYPVKADWTGAKYIGIDLDWDYERREVKLSMKGYVAKALKEFQHPQPTKPVYGPTPYTAPIYGRTIQYAPEIEAKTFTEKQIRHVQEVCGKFLYPARTVDNTMMHAINELCIAATEGTVATAKALSHFLNYCATNPEAEIIYRASDMILTIDSDAAYLVAKKARSRAAGYFYLSNKDGKLFNGPIFVLSKVIKAVMSSAAEAECGGLYINAHEAVTMRQTLIELGHQQPTNGTPIRTDNSTADGIMNRTVKANRSKSMDMRFWWLVDRVEQGQFRIFWAPGKVNLADYFSKKHPASHHKKVRPIYLHINGQSPTLVQGCDKILISGSKNKNHTALQTVHTAVRAIRLKSIPPYRPYVHTAVHIDPVLKYLHTKLARFEPATSAVSSPRHSQLDHTQYNQYPKCDHRFTSYLRY